MRERAYEIVTVTQLSENGNGRFAHAPQQGEPADGNAHQETIERTKQLLMNGLHKVKAVRMYVLKACASTKFNPKQYETSNLPTNAHLSTGGGCGGLEFRTGCMRYIREYHQHLLLARAHWMAMGWAGCRTTN